VIRPLLLLLAVVSCAAEPVLWDEVTPGDIDESPLGYRAPEIPGICRETFVWAHENGVVHAAWWNVRPDSTADLMVARETKASGWSIPERADTMDAGRVGCRRRAPAIAVSRGNVHLAYGMTAKEGPGVFTVHWMQGMTHAPVAVVYGERYGRTDIAARGDTVVVAYEDPNSNPRRIGLALSTTASHLFQYRTLVSPPTGEASDPLVALDSGAIIVAWTRTLRATQERVMRRGRFQ
jgi:hypothetical protein